MPKLSVTMVTQEEAMEVESGLVSDFKCVTFNSLPTRGQKHDESWTDRTNRIWIVLDKNYY